MTVLADSCVSAKVYVIFLIEQKSHASSAARQKILAIEQLIAAGDNFSDPSERDDTESLWQLQSILQLCGNHVPVDILACRVSAQLIICPVDAVPVERWLTAGGADTEIKGQHLFPP
jgi:hypothetical protein